MKLSLPVNSCGSFLICDSESVPGEYTLSVRSNVRVVHYKIRSLASGKFCVVDQIAFDTIPKLIEYYTEQSDGLCTRLTIPCMTEIHTEEGGNSIHLIKPLGKGKHSEVYEGLWENAVRVAVKIPKPETATEIYKSEIAVLRQLDNTKLVHFFTGIMTQTSIYMVMEFMQLGNLLQYLRGDGHSLEYHQIMDMAGSVASGMDYLRKQKIVHRNLSAQHILVTKSSGKIVCKISNFRLARVAHDDFYLEAEVSADQFAIRWLPPEAALHNFFTVLSDVWSFGILLYEVATYGDIPYPGMSDAQVLQAIQHGYRMPCPMGCSTHAYNIMKQCRNDYAANRPSFYALHLELCDFVCLDLHY